MVWLLNSQGISNCKSRESFCRSILVIYTIDLSIFWYVYCCYIYFLSVKFLNVSMPRTLLYPPWQPAHFGILEFLEFILNSIEKVKPGFSFPLMCMFPELNGTTCTRMDQRVTSWKWILTIFKCKNNVRKQLGFKNQMKKIGSLVLFSYLLPDLWSLNCQKLCPFCNILLISAKNLRLL